MEKKTSSVHRALRQLVQGAIRREREGWPPDTAWGVYQPQRPKTPLTDAAPDTMPGTAPDKKE